MNDLLLLAIAFIINSYPNADYVIYTCYQFGSFGHVFKLPNFTPFILELMPELTFGRRK